jgi:L-rhamnose mutarotase
VKSCVSPSLFFLSFPRGVIKWWHMMKDIMDTNPEESPVSDTLEELFHMD